MNVKMNLFAVSSPFFNAYLNSDIMGKLIFLSLLIISIFSWVVIAHKVWETYKVRQRARFFKNNFNNFKRNPLKIDVPGSSGNPFAELYMVLKRHTLDLLKKNQKEGDATSYLTSPDIDYVDTHLQMTIAWQIKKLEKNLYLLATFIPLAPFLGLLGTVWGILISFSEMQAQVVGSTQQAVLGGLSLALTTTVLGLIDAIPALIGYNYLRSTIRDFQMEMEGFSTDILATVEMQYRKVDAP